MIDPIREDVVKDLQAFLHLHRLCLGVTTLVDGSGLLCTSCGADIQLCDPDPSYRPDHET